MHKNYVRITKLYILCNIYTPEKKNLKELQNS